MTDPSRAAETPYALAGVMGWPVAHSRSPVIHNHWLQHYGRDGAYVKLAVPPERLGRAVRALPELGFAGCNLTIPLKEAALACLDTVSPRARRIGAVNCVEVRPGGELSGDNTDVFGWLESVRAAVPGWRADRGPAVLLGAGGAARAVLDGLLGEGAPEVRVVNRSPARAAALRDAFGPRVVPVAWEARATCLDGAALLVNTTSLGMEGQAPLDLPLDALPRAAVVSDIVYVPRETALLAAARARGHRVAGGLGMLLHQARPAFAAWFGVMPAVTPELWAAVEASFGDSGRDSGRLPGRL